MSNVYSILESLEIQRTRENIINEAVKVAYDDEQKMKKSSRVIRKTFGKIVTPKETWYNMSDLMANPEGEDSPLVASYRSKFFNVNASYSEFPIDVALEILKKYVNVPYDRIIKMLYKASKEKFHIEQISNLRMIFQSDKNKNHRVELRYDKKLYKKDMGSIDDAEEDIDTPEESQESEEIKAQEMEERAKVKALESKDTDERDAEVKKAWVRENMSNKINAFEKEAVNVDEIEKESGATKVVAKASAVVAEDLFEKSSKEEPDISKELVGVVSSLGGMMFGLDFRLKQPTSLGRKIADDATHDNKYKGDVKEAASGVKDTIRYTAIYDLEDFTEKYFATKAELERLGYVELRCKNFYTMFANGKSQQKAIQCVYFKKPDGILFELQFHTVESQGVKEVNHPMYEKFRDKSTPKETLVELGYRMQALGNTVPDPIGVFDIPEHS